MFFPFSKKHNHLQVRMLIILEYAFCVRDSVLQIPGNGKHIRRQ